MSLAQRLAPPPQAIRRATKATPRTTSDPRRSVASRTAANAGAHEREVNEGDKDHRPQELALQGEQLAAQNLTHGQGGRKQQFQGAAAIIRAELLAGFRGYPKLDRRVQEDGGGDISAVRRPVVRPFEIAPKPETPDETDETPDEHRLKPMPAAEPEAGT